MCLRTAKARAVRGGEQRNHPTPLAQGVNFLKSSQIIQMQANLCLNRGSIWMPHQAEASEQSTKSISSRISLTIPKHMRSIHLIDSFTRIVIISFSSKEYKLRINVGENDDERLRHLNFLTAVSHRCRD
jgi:hypothetical protein